VLDASALIAFLRCEPGGELVGPVLADAAISTVNLSEVLTKAADSPEGIGPVEAALRDLPLRVVLFDEYHATLAAQLRPATRAFGLSLGDRACLALGAAEGLPVLTTETEWKKANLAIDIRPIRERKEH
jgi:PIN domain nuclease of toxin-antitoxin system